MCMILDKEPDCSHDSDDSKFRIIVSQRELCILVMGFGALQRLRVAPLDSRECGALELWNMARKKDSGSTYIGNLEKT